ncbi:hypothetical protein O8C79_05925 [Aliarcobacter butzleri]|uniref:hypothetical protein n=1 Tax=Aliarcobacter butzleri TaxID=28197 RepID=UPI00263D45D0|nr:hypothetical protein [Aliarcobacter butzleri]MDN5104827.1 hypothetical protein [Aliarcobacter butzleri]
MKKHKLYIFLTIIFTFILFALGIGIRYIIDPVGLNNKFDLGLKKDIALAYRTQKYVELTNFKPNTLMIGGSRVQYLNTEDVKKYTNDKVYNLGLQFSTLEEQYYFLKYSLENFPIKNVIIGLNLYPFSQRLEDNKSDFDKDLLIARFSVFNQIKHYLEVPLFKYLQHSYENQDKEADYKNGSITLHHQNRVIQNNDKELLWKITLEGYKNKYFDYLEWGEDSLYYYKKIVELCKEYNINLKIFTTAVHSSMFKLLEETEKMDIFYLWKEELSKIAPYWDFMTQNSVSDNEDNYIDPSHLKQELGYLYFARIFDDKRVEVPEDFGIFVEKK